MDDRTNAREDFFSTFPAQYRDHIIAFSKKLSTLDVDVLLFTARKAVCMFHCLESLEVFQRGEKLAISERWMDHDRSWLEGKRVAIIDEVIVTGTSIYELHKDLIAAGAKHVEVHCLFINSTYFVEDFFKDIDLAAGYIRLEGAEAQSLSTAIVQAMYQLPRPYSVDYPMSAWNDIAESSLPRLVSLPGWETVERHWMDIRAHSSERRTAYFRISPRGELVEEVDSALGANLCGRSLVKVRLYGAMIPGEQCRRYVFRIVPYVVLGELPVDEINRMFARMVSELSLNDQELLTRSCVSAVTQLRLIQYVYASRLASYWVDQLRRQAFQITFRQDSVELDYLFPLSLHAPILKLCSPPSDSTPVEKIDWPESTSPVVGEKPRTRRVPAFFVLSKPFHDRYVQKELELRRLARSLGVGIFAPKYQRLLNRLKDGCSIEWLKSYALRNGVSSNDSTFSDFLDFAIDSGIVVPITASRNVKGKKFLYRAYRHGEETYILLRDLAMFHAMLECFQREWDRHDLSPGGQTIPRLVIDKILVLFFRYAIANDLIRTTYERLDEADDVIPLNIGFHKHGARLAVGRHDPTEFPADRAFVNLLVDRGILQKDSSGGYVIPPDDGQALLDKKRRSTAIKFSTVAAKVFTIPPDLFRPKEEGRRVQSPKEVRDRLLVALTSCETGTSTLMAVAAELRLFCEDFRNFSVPIRNPAPLLAKLSTHNSRFFLSNAVAKIFSHLERIAARSAEVISSALGEESIEGAVWQDIWGTVATRYSVEEEREANQQLLQCLRVAWRTECHILFLRIALHAEIGSSATADVRSAKSLIERMRRRGKRLLARTAGKAKRGGGVSAFGEESLRLAEDLEAEMARLSSAGWRPIARAINLAQMVAQERAELVAMYRRVDERYRERQSFSDVDTFDTVAAFRVGRTSCDKPTFRHVAKHLGHRISDAISAAYQRRQQQKLRGAAVECIELRTRRTDESVTFRFYARGTGSASHVAAIIATALAEEDWRSTGLHPRWYCVCGLDETRSYRKVRGSDEFTSSSGVEQAIEEQIQAGTSQGTLLISGPRAEVRHRRMDEFKVGFESVARELGVLASSEDSLKEALGGEATIAVFDWPGRVAPRASAETKSVLVFATEWASHHGGLSTFNRLLCKALAEAGADVVCVAAKGDESDREDARANGVRLQIPDPIPGASGSDILFQSFPLPMEFRPNILIGHSRMTGPAAQANQMSRFQDAARIHFLHIAPSELEHLKKAEGAAERSEDREKIEVDLSANAAVIGAVGRRLFEEFEAVMPDARDRLHLFQPGVVINKAANSPISINKCLILGRDDFHLKGLDIAAGAVGRAAAHWGSMEHLPSLVVRGAQPGTGDALRAQLSKLCGNSNVHIDVREFAASDTRIQTQLLGTSILLMPSRAEGFGLVALEAIALGVPILVSANSGVALFLRDHALEFAEECIVQTSATTDGAEADMDRWAGRITAVLRDKERAFKRANLLRERLKAAVSWKSSAKALLDFVEASTQRAIRT